MEERYKLKSKNDEKYITKDGHTMFIEDVVKELNRKAYLEDQLRKGQLIHKKN